MVFKTVYCKNWYKKDKQNKKGEQTTADDSNFDTENVNSYIMICSRTKGTWCINSMGLLRAGSEAMLS